MTKTIAKLWNGNLEPATYSGESNAEIKKLERFMYKNLEELEKILDEKESKVFEKYNDSIGEYLVEISEQVFCDGFSLGARVASEALINAERFIK